jgi:hypothetical protein
MKTNEQILERYLSQESVDFFGTQRQLLLCLLPYKLAKPYLDENYVMQHDNDTLPEDERWLEGGDLKKQLMDFMPGLDKAIHKGASGDIVQGFLALRVWLWVMEDEIYPEIEKDLNGELLADQKEDLFKRIANHIGYKPIVEDIAFEELPKDS